VHDPVSSHARVGDPGELALRSKARPEGGRHFSSQLARTSGRYGRFTARPTVIVYQAPIAPLSISKWCPRDLRRRLNHGVLAVVDVVELDAGSTVTMMVTDAVLA